MNNHDFIELNYDYSIAKQLNEIDQKKEEQTYKSMLGSGNSGKNRK